MGRLKENKLYLSVSQPGDKFCVIVFAIVCMVGELVLKNGEKCALSVAEYDYKKINIDTIFLLHFSDHLRLF